MWEMLLQRLNHFLKRIFKVGFVRAGGEFEIARKSVISRSRCTIIVDGGANSGQWSTQVRKNFPEIKIYSFEPLKAPFELLQVNSLNDKNWLIKNEGLGKNDEVLSMYVSSNEGMSSSFKKPTNHLTEFQTVKFGDHQRAQIRRLDTDPDLKGQTIYLKLDVQGSEWDAIQGCTGLLNEITAIEVETTLVSMYEGDLTHYELIPKIISLGFTPYAISPAHKKVDGRCTYMDVILVRDELLVRNS